MRYIILLLIFFCKEQLKGMVVESDTLNYSHSLLLNYEYKNDTLSIIALQYFYNNTNDTILYPLKYDQLVNQNIIFNNFENKYREYYPNIEFMKYSKSESLIRQFYNIAPKEKVVIISIHKYFVSSYNNLYFSFRDHFIYDSDPYKNKITENMFSLLDIPVVFENPKLNGVFTVNYLIKINLRKKTIISLKNKN